MRTACSSSRPGGGGLHQAHLPPSADTPWEQTPPLLTEWQTPVKT